MGGRPKYAKILTSAEKSKNEAEVYEKKNKQVQKKIKSFICNYN